jgi:hypothetical protein
MTPINAVRNPNFDSAMANQNYQNSLAGLRAKMDAGRGEYQPIQPRPSPEPGAQGADPRAPQYGFDKSKRKSGKEILLSFAGGQYGSINDEAANAIAKKYNLEIFSKPNPNRDEGPRVYGFSVKGNVDKGLSGIRNEPGIRYVEANSRGFIPERGPDPFITYEDNRMRAALNGEELPAPPVGYVEGFDRSKKTPSQRDLMLESPKARGQQGPQQGQFTQGRLMGAPSGQFGDIARRLEQSGQLPYQQQFDPNAPSLMPIRTPGSDALNQDLANRGMGGGIPTPMPQPQQMQNYNNFLQQGIQRSNTMNQDAAAGFANLQPGMQPAQPAMPVAGMGAGMQQPRKAPAPRKFSTVNTPSARFG